MIRRSLFSDEQKRAIKKLQDNGRGICWWKLGEGKTRIALGWFALLQKQFKPAVMLFVTRPIAFGTVADEIRKLAYSWSVVEYKKSKRNFSHARPTVILISHAGLAHWCWLCDLPISCICFDEIHYFGNPKSQRSEGAKILAEQFDFRVVGLGGSLMSAQDNTTIWGQSLVIGIQRLLARNLTEYRKSYQRSSLLDFGAGRKTIQFRNAPHAHERIMARLAPWVDFNMPKRGRKRVEQKHGITLTKEQRQLIKQLREEYYLKLEKFNFELDMASAMGIVCAISRIANGYLLRPGGETIDLRSPKLDFLCQRLEDIAQVEQSQAIVWCHFRSDLPYLSRQIPFASLQMSGSKKLDRDAWETGRYSVMLATEAIGSSVNDFAQVPYAIYFSMSYKWLDLQQSMGRIDRKNSKHEQCHYDFLLAEGSFDETIYEAAKCSGRDEANLIKTGIQKWLKET